MVGLGGVLLTSLVFESHYSAPRLRMGVDTETPIYVIGLVGTAGAGKSTAARWLAQKGCDVLSADKLGHESYLAGSPCHGKIVSRFGARVLAESGEIDRSELASIVFGNDGSRRALEAIVWPEIEQRIRGRIQQRREEARRWQVLCGGRAKQSQLGRHCLVLEAAVAIPAGWTKYCDEVWLIDHPDKSALRDRLVTQRGLDRSDADRRLELQASWAAGETTTQIRDKLARKGVAASIVSNAGSLSEFSKAVNRQWDATARRASSQLYHQCFQPSKEKR